MSPSAIEVRKTFIESEEERYRRLLREAKIEINELLDEARTAIGSPRPRTVPCFGFAVDRGFEGEAGVLYVQPVFRKDDSLIAAGGPNFCCHPEVKLVYPDGKQMLVRINWGKPINYPIIHRIEAKGDSLSLLGGEGESASGYLDLVLVDSLFSEYRGDAALDIKTKLSMAEAILTGLKEASGLLPQDEGEKMVPGYPK